MWVRVNSAKYIFLMLLAFGVSIVLVVFESASYVYYEAQNVYRVYLNGKSIGLIKDKGALEDYVNKEQQNLKNKYNVDNVYIPQGLKITNETTYNQDTESIESIYNKISDEEDFTINGYTITITDLKDSVKNENGESSTQKIKEYLYVLDENILREAVDEVVKSFVDENEYVNYLNEIKKDQKAIGESIENVYVKEQISVKKGRIPANQKIYQTKQELAKYLLFGTNDKNKIYKVKDGDSVKSIANSNKMSTDEFLIANQDISDENALLYKGQEVVISYINPRITIVEETHSVKKESLRYKTIEKTDDNLMPGHYEVIQKGKKGESKVTRKIEKQNGKITEALIISSEVIKEPINKVVKTGSSVDWAWPTVSNYTITEHFGYVLRSDIGESSARSHDGIDIAGLGCGSPVYAANSGTVIFAGWGSGLGNEIEISHGKGIVSTYAHLNSVYVSSGQSVKKGQRIGAMGNTGYSFGCHLHFQLSKGGSLFDPLSLY